MKPLKVLSCFDGISAGRLALERAGIPVECYYSFEIDKYAIKVTQSHYPETVQLGDITNWKKHRKSLPVFDLIIGGSPCQGFSNAGKGLNFDDPRSKLFFVFVDIIKYYKKKNKKLKFMLENVRMKKEWQDVITQYMGVEPVKINSALLSAQNRVRLYWTNIGKIEQPEDRGIYLKDILEHGDVDRDKSYCIDANYFKGGNEKRYKTKASRQLVKLPSVQGAALRNQITKRGTESQLNIRKDNKSNAVVSSYPSKLNGVVVSGAALRTYPRQPTGKKRIKQLEVRKDEKSNNLTSVETDSLVVIRRNGHGYIPTEIKAVAKSDTLREATNGNYLIYDKLYLSDKEIEQQRYKKGAKNLPNGKREGNIEFPLSLNRKSLCLCANGIDGNHRTTNVIDDGIGYRKLTPVECERLQTFPDSWTDIVSNTQRYKQCGNSWTVDVVAHIFSYLKENKRKEENPMMRQKDAGCQTKRTSFPR